MANLAMIMWRAWSVQNNVTRAEEALPIDDSVAYLARLGLPLDYVTRVRLVNAQAGQRKEAQVASGLLLRTRQ
jgi:hypothetical protein